MWLRSLFHSRQVRSSGRPSPRRPRWPGAFRPILETLEDRRLLSFNPSVNYAAGLNPQAVAAADFNGDGKLDLAIANHDSNTVSVWLGQGNGAFQQGPTHEFATGTGPRSLTVGDFNGDARPDLATANETDNSVSVLLGNGDGTFQARGDIPIITPPGYGLIRTLAVVAGDVDANGKMDLVATSYSAYSGPYGFYFQGYAHVLLGNGSGTFADPVFYTLPAANPQGVDLGDVNADGKLDVVTANQEGSLSVLLGNGDGTLQAGLNSYVGSGNHSVALADLNGDGKLDAATEHEYGTVDVALGDGAGDFLAPQSYATGVVPSGVVAADFNGDGKLDLATADAGGPVYDPSRGSYFSVTGSVSILLNKGDGTFTLPISMAAGTSPTGLTRGDFNGDGRPDLVAVNAGSANASVLRNDGAWSALTAPALSVADATVSEGNVGTTVASFTVTLSAASASAVTVDYSTADFGATAGSDYQATSGTVTFAPGQTAQTILIPVIGDRFGEGDERFTVILRNPTNAFLADSLAVGTIQDDEPQISIGDVTVVEGNTGTRAAEFTVSLSAAYDADVTVDFATAAGSAAPGSDYENQTGTLTIPRGQTTGTITVRVVGDRVFEQTYTYYDDGYGGYYTVVTDDENFLVNLSNPKGAVIVDGQGVGTISDDEPRISIGDASVTEGNTGTREITFTVSLATAYDQDVTVAYATADASATAGSDYQAKSGTLIIPAGQTSGTVSVVVSGDRIAEGDYWSGYAEYFSVNLGVSNYGGLADAQGLGFINDDDPHISITSYVALPEGKSGTTRFVFTVSLSAAYDQTVTVKFATKNGTARAGKDYTATSGTLTFKPGETTKTITVLVKGDNKKESDEDFQVVLSGASSNALIVDAVGIGNILDDDRRGRRK